MKTLSILLTVIAFTSCSPNEQYTTNTSTPESKSRIKVVENRMIASRCMIVFHDEVTNQDYMSFDGALVPLIKSN